MDLAQKAKLGGFQKMKNHLRDNGNNTTETHEGQYLSTLSPRHEAWDIHRSEAQDVEAMYREIRWPAFQNIADHIRNCSGYLGFALVPDENGEEKLKLTRVYFCRARYCPVCQWRRQLVLKAKFTEALECIYERRPDVRWVFLTLTVKNVPIEELRTTIKDMNSAWIRLMRRKDVKGILGWAKAVEVTRGTDGDAHPHFHILLMVKPSYFTGKYYISQRKWTQMWRECMKLDYTPIVHVQAVKNNEKKAIAELMKYSVKPSDLVKDAEWLMDLTTQTKNLRFISFGGELRKTFKFLRDLEKHLGNTDEMTFVDEDEEGVDIDMSLKNLEPEVWFSWSRKTRKYVLY